VANVCRMQIATIVSHKTLGTNLYRNYHFDIYPRKAPGSRDTMAGTGASSPYIKDEPEDHFSPFGNQRFMGNGQQGFSQGFGQLGSINPNDLMGGNGGLAIQNGQYGSLLQNGFVSQAPSSTANFAKAGLGSFGDDELLDDMSPSLGAHPNQLGLHGNGDFGIDFNSGLDYGHNGSAGMAVNPNQYSNTPDGDPIQSPFVMGNFNYLQQRQNMSANGQHFGGSLHSPASYNSSPLVGSDLQHGRRPNGVRRNSSTRERLVGKAAAMSLGSGDSSFPTPIRTPVHRHQKTLSGQWDQANSLNSYNGSEFSSPPMGVHPNPQISDILKTGSMPAKLNNLHQTSSAPALQSQEMKRRRRRESHNLVERRRRDNINERIQELSHLVPLHRLEDEKVRKALQNNSPLSPTLAGLSQPPGLSPPQATSGLVPPGARRATAGNITTGIPIEEKDKGPNKGDILNGAVSWTRDLMWMLHVKMEQMEELNQMLRDRGEQPPFQETEEEQRMRTELMEAMVKNDGSKFRYSRAPGTGLRVPNHTDLKGDALGASNGQNETSLSPDNHSSGGDMAPGQNQYWSGHNSGGSGPGSISFKEEDEYMDLVQ
jgi:hypothetical protein